MKTTQIHVGHEKKQCCSNAFTAPNKCEYIGCCFLSIFFLLLLVIYGVCVRIGFLYGYDFLSIFSDASHCEGSQRRSWEKQISLLIFLPFFFTQRFRLVNIQWRRNECKKIERRIVKMYRMISQAWTCNLMDFSLCVGIFFKNLIVRESIWFVFLDGPNGD